MTPEIPDYMLFNRRSSNILRPISKPVADGLYKAYGASKQAQCLWQIYFDLKLLKDLQEDFPEEVDRVDFQKEFITLLGENSGVKGDLEQRFRLSDNMAGRRLENESSRNAVDVLSKKILVLI